MLNKAQFLIIYCIARIVGHELHVLILETVIFAYSTKIGANEIIMKPQFLNISDKLCIKIMNYADKLTDKIYHVLF